MSTITIPRENQNLLDVLNQHMDAMMPRLSKMLTVDRLVDEAHVIGVTESVIPDNLKFDLHFDMIVGLGERSLSQYTSGLNDRYNHILEAARKALPGMTEITESIESFKQYLINQLNEDVASQITMGAPSSAMAASGFDTALSGGELEARKGGGFWGTLKKIWNALTEGGSAWGVFHLILDIIGLVGDFIIPGVGVAADIINAIVYLMRGEYFLALISIIAAVIVGGGDALKLYKPIAKEAGGVVAKLSVKPGMDVSQALVNVGAKDTPMVMRCLAKIASLGGSAVAKAIGIMSGFFNGFGKVVGKIPGLGRLIRPIFDKMGSLLTSLSNKVSNFAQNYALLSKKVAKESLGDLAALAKNAKAEGTVFKFSDDGTVLYAFNKEGKRVAKLPSDFVEKSKFFDIRFGEGGASRMFNPANGPLAKQVNMYYKTIPRIANNTKLTDGFVAYFTKTIPKASVRFFKVLPYFLGKQIYKLIFGNSWKEGESKWTRDELDAHGSAALSQWISDRLGKVKAETGATFPTDLYLDSSEEEVNQQITDYQNHYAKITNQPNIVSAIEKPTVTKDIQEEFDSFWGQVEHGKVRRGEAGDKIDHSNADSLSKSFGANEIKTQPRAKFESRSVLSFSDFKKKTP